MKFIAAAALATLLFSADAWAKSPVEKPNPDADRLELLAVVSRQVIGPERHFIGFANRQAPMNKTDSGWAFLSGKESQEFLDDSSNSIALPLRQIIEIDPSLTGLLDQPADTYWERSDPGSAWREIVDYSREP